MFTLTVFPDGKLLLTTEDHLTEETAREVGSLFERWYDARDAKKPLILTETRVQHATSLDVDLTGPEDVELERVEG